MIPLPAHYRRDLLILAGLTTLSLVVTATTNRMAGRYLTIHVPSLAWIASAALPSCLTIAGLFILFADKAAIAWSRSTTIDARSVVRLSVGWLTIWLASCTAAALLTGHWITYAKGWPAIAAFLVFGPLGEELLFRGVLYGRARALWPASPMPATIVSTVAFSLHHGVLNTAPVGLAVAQLLFTIPMGVVFAILRERTRSVWPGVMLHVLTNVPATIG